jgi:hypothetical protein
MTARLAASLALGLLLRTQLGAAQGIPPVPVDASPAAGAATSECPAGLVCRAGSDGVVRAYRRGVRHRSNDGLTIAGAALLGGGWLINIPLSGVSTLLLAPDATARPDDYFAWSFVPIVGPIVQIFQVGTQHWDIPILAVVEAVEVVGLVMAILGTVGEDVNVLEPVDGLALHLVPWAGEEGGGLLAGGRF